MTSSNLFSFIDSLNIDKRWKTLFKKIHVVYHNNYFNGKMLDTHFWSKSPDFKRMSLNNQSYFVVNFNLLGFLLGPFYYFIKGMLIKGAILFAIFLPLFFYLKFLLVPLFLYCGYFVNRDYFAYTILKNKKSGYNIMLLNDPPDRAFILEIVSKKHNYLPLIILTFIVCWFSFYTICNNIKQNYILQDKFNNIPVVCKGKENCQNYIMSSVKEITLLKDTNEISKKYYLIAIAYLENKDFYNAINALSLALNIDEKNINALYLRATLCYKDKRFAQSVIDYKEVLKIMPQAYFLNLYIGKCYYELGMYDYASLYFNIAAKKTKEPLAYEYLGYSELKNNNPKEAKSAAEKAIKVYKKKNNQGKVQSLEQFIKNIK